MEKKYLALLAAVAVIGAVAFVPANVAGVDAVEEDDKIELPLSDMIPAILFTIALLGFEVLVLIINLDLGNFFLDLDELALGVKEVNLGAVITLFGLLELPLMELVVPKAIITILPPGLELAIGANPLIVWEGFELALSAWLPSFFISVSELLPMASILPLLLGKVLPIPLSTISMILMVLGLILGFIVLGLPGALLGALLGYSLIGTIGGFVGDIIAMIIDFPISVMFSLNAGGVAFSFSVYLALLAGMVVLDPIPPIDIDLEWPW